MLSDITYQMSNVKPTTNGGSYSVKVSMTGHMHLMLTAKNMQGLHSPQLKQSEMLPCIPQAAAGQQK